ncbi:MAG: septal ring lytic transglycosylase RlpA family protein [Burkholderiales bacterium]|nr:septal ring lytic transglycosylase RlpA family protein [Burkholderiales bacterium]
MSRWPNSSAYVWAALLGLLLAACSTVPPHERSGEPGPRRERFYANDGPPERIPVDLDRIPDAIPREETLHRFANRPYTVFGVEYTPMTALAPVTQRGIASWYGRKFHGQRTATGEIYDMFAMTAAHPTFPLPSYARVTNPRNGRSVIVRVNDRGPFLHGRIIDLSYAAAHRLGIAQTGSGEVTVELLVPPFAERLASAPAPETRELSVASAPAVPSRATETRAPEGDGRWVVQLGAFGNFANANAFQQRMHHVLGQTVQVRQIDGLFRVQLGPYANRQEAEAARRHAEHILGTSLPLVLFRP